MKKEDSIFLNYKTDSGETLSVLLNRKSISGFKFSKSGNTLRIDFKVKRNGKKYEWFFIRLVDTILNFEDVLKFLKCNT